MSYKRVVKKKGKSYGPYIYESYRDENGKVQKRYLGKLEEKKPLPFLMLIFGFLVLLFLLGGGYTTDLFFNEGRISDKSVNFVETLYSSVVDGVTGLIISGEEVPSEDIPQESSPEEAPEDSPSETEDIPQESSPEEAPEDIPAVDIEDKEEVEEYENETVVEESPTNETEVENISEEPTNITLTNETVVEESPTNETEVENISEEPTNITLTNETIIENITLTNETIIENITLTNETIIENVTSPNTTTLQYKAVIGRPVKWIKTIDVIEGNLSVDLPPNAENISVLTDGEVGVALGEVEKYSDVVEDADREDLSEGGILTGRVVLDIKKGSGWLTRFLDWLTGFTISGKVVLEEDLLDQIADLENETIIELGEVIDSSGAEEIAVEYYTEAPVANETNLANGKRVVVSAPSELNYSEVLAYTLIEENILMGDPRLRVYWYEDFEDEEDLNAKVVELLEFGPLSSGKESSYVSYDFDEDGYVDYIEWIVPHLSAQTYEIIYITGAQHLDENRTEIEDIYDYVKEQDDNWTVIPAGDYVRVGFEQNLTNEKDITLYVRSEEIAIVEVYLKDEEEVIMTFDNISDEGIYKKYLLNISEGESYDTFDLKVLNNDVEFDYIVDPEEYPSGSENVSECTVLSTANKYYTLNTSFTSTEANCIQFGADNITLDFNGFTLDGNGEQDCVEIYKFSEPALSNITVKNGYLTNCDLSITIRGVASLINISNMTLIDGASSSWGIGVSSSEEGVFIENVNISGMPSHGIFINGAAGGINISNTSVYNCGTSASGVHKGLLIDTTDNVIVRDSNFSSSVLDEGDWEIWAQDSSTDHQFINVSYNISSENLTEGTGTSSLYRKWYYSGKVNDSSGNDKEGVYVAVFDSTDNLESNTSTNALGESSRTELIDYYVEDSSRTFDTPHQVVVYNGTHRKYKKHNLTDTENIVLDVLTLGEEEFDAPEINITSPINGSTVYESLVSFNLTVDDETLVDECWYSLNGGITNNIMTFYEGDKWPLHYYFNATNDSIDSGDYVANFYCNDSFGVVNNTENSTFTIDSGPEVYSCRELGIADQVYVLQNNLTTDSTCFTVTADNVTLDLNGHNITGDGGVGSYGVYSALYNSSRIFNGSIYDFYSGVFLSSSDNSQLENLTIQRLVPISEHPAGQGVWILDSQDVIIRGNFIYDYWHSDGGTTGTCISAGGASAVSRLSNLSVIDNYMENCGFGGVNLQYVDDSLFLNNSANRTSLSAYILQDSDDNNFINNSAFNGTSDAGALGGCGILFINGVSDGNTFSGGIINHSTGWGIKIGPGSNNFFSDIQISETQASGVNLFDVQVIKAFGAGDGTNNTFINVTYNQSREGTSCSSGASCEIFRGWWFDAEVNETGGDYLDGAGVNVTNSSDDNVYSDLTSDGGQVDRDYLIEYSNIDVFGTPSEITYYGNYTINTSKAGYITNSTTYNLTADRESTPDDFGPANIFHIVSLEIEDTDPPNVSVVLPVDGESYANSTINFNISLQDASPLGDCLLEIGVLNHSMDINDESWANKTIVGIDHGSYVANFYCNDSLSNMNNTESVSFDIDLKGPDISITLPINNTNTTNTQLDINYTSGDDAQSCWWSNDSGVTTTLLASCSVNITGETWPEGLNEIIIYTNDSLGNENSSNVSFTLDTISPIVSVVYPVEGERYSINVSDFNYSVSEDGSGGSSCWWSNDSGVTNFSSVSFGTNFSSVSGTDGENVWRVYCNDSAGNEGISTISFNSSYLSKCGTLYQANEEYILYNNLTKSGTCFTISASNITLDFNGYNITGDGTGKGVAIEEDNASVSDGGIFNFQYGVYSEDKSNSLIENNTLDSNILFGAYISGGLNNSVINNTITGSPLDYYIGDGVVSEYSFVGNSLNVSDTNNGNVLFLNESLYASGDNLSEVISITSNNVFVNSTLDSGFNTTANITLLGVSTSPTIQAIVDYDDDGTFESCPDTCVNLSHVDNVFIFNVTHFTSYSTNSTNSLPDNPIVILNSSDGSNKTLQNLGCFAILSDNDGGNMNVSVDWHLNGSLGLSESYNGNYANETLFVAWLDSGNTTKHENWSCAIRVSDGIDNSSWGNSSNLTILNSLPEIVLDSPEDNSSTTNRTPKFNWTSSDDDGDSMTYEINITRQGGLDTCTDIVRNEDGLVSESYIPSIEFACVADNNNYYTWKVRGSDSEGVGDWSDERNLSISSVVTVTLTTQAMAFGSTAEGESNDTTNGAPGPFVIRNDGNALVNVSINSTALWGVEEDETFRFKVDNVSGEEGAFSWLTSITSWFDVPLTGGVVAIDSLNHSEATDSAEIDIYVKVPVGEESGSKNANIAFTSSLSE
jgi:parallel beta-helix repeat protein